MRIIVIVGAARSGTKLIRDVLASAPGGAAVPYDVNYVWRLGNESVPHDALDPSHLETAKITKIRRQVQKYGRSSQFLIEKTVASPLRIPFVHGVFPEAQYVFLTRDPVDVVESVLRQWTSEPDWRYVMQKARRFPFASAPRYAFREAGSMAKRAIGSGQRSVWGVRYPGIETDLQDQSLLDVCAKQWNESMLAAVKGFAEVGVEPTTVAFEDLAKDPESTSHALSDRLAIPPADPQAIARIRPSSIGRGREGLTEAFAARVRELTGPAELAIHRM